jgi:uncharacterized repeat protein (TIGR03803 family)
MTIRQFSLGRWQTALAVAIMLALPMPFIQAAHVQTYTVLHTFTGGVDGAAPYAGLAWDGGSNFYGTASQGGYTGTTCYDLPGGTASGCGTVFQLHRSGSNWTFSTLYEFRGGTVDGNLPIAPVTIARDGSLYGTTWAGDYNGSHLCRWIGVGAPTVGCGIVFNLKPPTTACKTALCSWTETISWAFPGTNEGGGSGPGLGQLVFDQAGNLYGTNFDSYLNPGEAFQLVPSGGGWMPGNTYVTTDAPGSDSPFIPLNAITLDSAGNLYSTSELGPENTPNCGGPAPLNGCGTVFQLTPGSSGWNANILYTFTDGADGKFPIAGLVADPAGNLYGVSSTDGPESGGTVFKLSPSGGSWTYHQIYALPNGYPQDESCFIALNTRGCSGPWGTLLIDAAGNLYGASNANGTYHCGNVFKLTPSNGSWIYTDLHDFTCGSDGGNPAGSLILDGNGNLYGTTIRGGSAGYGYGVVFEITP